MHLKSIYLNKVYDDYLQGAEVESTYNSLNEKVEPGQHIIVFKDTPASNVHITVAADQESKSIGVEGIITQVNRTTDLRSGDIVQRIRLKRA